MRCLNGTPHEHTTVQESRECWLGDGTSQSQPQSQPHPIEARTSERPATHSQLSYIRSLGGDADQAASLNTRDASALIKDLKTHTSVPQNGTPRRSGSLAVTQPSKLEMVLPLLSVVPDGYFAVQLDANSKMEFVRLSTVTHKDSLKLGYRRIQTIHGPNLDLAAEINLDGKVREYKQIDDAVLLIIADYQGAALRYAKEIGKCCRCNTRLTSDWRKVGVGPECVKHWPWAVERAAAAEAERNQS